MRGISNHYGYGATKAAVIGLAKAVAAGFIKKGVQANAICPGTIASSSCDARIETLARTTGLPVESVLQAFIDRQPIGRPGQPEEIAAMAVCLGAMSQPAKRIRSFLWMVDGGFAL